MCQRCHGGQATDRRHFLLRTASALGAAGVLGLFPHRQGAQAAARGASGPIDLAHPTSATALQRALPAPLPIPGGGEAPPPVGFVHGWFVPGPEGTVTPIIRIPALGLDVEPSLITDFMGVTAFTILAGQAEGSDGKTYNLESDLRVMQGQYIAEDGSRQQGTFAFF
jgi:hypothetical protein